MPTPTQIFSAQWPIAQNFFRGWAEYRRAQKTSPAHAAGSSRGSLAPLPPQKIRGRNLFYFKESFTFVLRHGGYFLVRFLR
jgi:hypothetical protein